MPVHSTIILLRPVADGPDINGLFESAIAAETSTTGSGIM